MVHAGSCRVATLLYQKEMQLDCESGCVNEHSVFVAGGTMLALYTPQ